MTTILGQNWLLSVLREEEKARLSPEVVRLSRGTLIYEAGGRIGHVYFPHDCVISLVAVLQDGRQVRGSASRVPLEALAALMADRPPVRELLMAYVRALFAQVLQSVACNASHSVEERCARWLLMTHDRAGSDTFDLTQEFLSEMLGVRRASVNLVSRMFQQAGLIRYSRGHITVLDRAGLEATACECYGIIDSAFARLMPQVSRE